MKPTNKHEPYRKARALVLCGVLAGLITTIACSTDTAPAARASQSPTASAPSAKPQTVSSAVAVPVAAKETVPATRPAAGTLHSYRSRDYGVSFLYPWQYAFLNAKAVASGDPSRLPQSDGYEGQFTLARIEIPRGFYPDTDFDSGYFMLSLNPDLGEQECQAVLTAGENAAVQTDTINGVMFRWVETDSGGRGSAVRLRNYAAFVNDTCYELELGVKTSNEDGMAREIDPGQVLRRLDAILRSVKFSPAPTATAAAEATTSSVTPPPQH